MKKIMLIGDSIRLGYMPFVKEMLEGEATVWGPEDNCRFARYTFFNLPIWLEEMGCTPDIIHWNNGIWDITNRAQWCTEEPLTTLEEYLRDIKRTLKIMKNTGARIVFATTTPVNDKNPSQKNSDIDLYNASAVHLLQSEGVIINDLNAYIKPHIAEWLRDDMTHLNEEGYQAAAKQVVSIIKELI